MNADAALIVDRSIALIRYAEQRVRVCGDLEDAADALTVAARVLRQAAKA